MSPRGFEWMEHEGEMGIQAWGVTLEDLFQAAADGLYDLLRHHFTIVQATQREIALEAPDVEVLLKDFLSELLYAQSTHHEVYPERVFHELSPRRLRAILRGGRFDITREPLEREIKAITYYRLQVWQDAEGRWRATYVVDV
ncbi:MAG: archease [Acidobacteria bacterium]|nr:archease [Acidobacteriota bacterium]MDW7985108.1 archease [Acidobacteriota bacterium]